MSYESSFSIPTVQAKRKPHVARKEVSITDHPSYVQGFQERIHALQTQEPRHDRDMIRNNLRSLARGRVGNVLRAFIWSFMMSSGTQQAMPRQHNWEDVIGSVEMHEGQENLPSVEVMERYLLDQYGERELANLLPAQHINAEQAEQSLRREQEEPRVEVTGAETIGLRNSDLREYVVHGFPRHLTGRTSVHRIRVSSEREPMPSEYGMHGNEAGHCTVSPGNHSSEIVIYGDRIAGEMRMREVEEMLTLVLPHELIHAGDAHNAASLDYQTRVEALYIATNRMQSPDKLQHPYFQSIQNPDPQHRLALQVGEYIADTGRAMFGYRLSHVTDPAHRLTWRQGMATRLSQDYHTTPQAAMLDVRMIERLVGPEFNWQEAAQARETILNRITLEGAFTTPIEHAIHNMDDHRLRQDLLRLFRTHRHEVSELYHFIDREDDEVGTKMDLRPHETVQQEDVRIERELSLVRRVGEFSQAVEERLETGLPREAILLLNEWMGVVDVLSDARASRWYPSEHASTLISNVTGVASRVTERTVRFQELMHRYHRVSRLPALRRAMGEYLRLIGYGELRVPPSLLTEVQRFNRDYP